MIWSLKPKIMAALPETLKVNVPQIASHNLYGSTDKRTNADKFESFIKKILTVECVDEGVHSGDLAYLNIGSRMLGVNSFYEKARLSQRLLTSTQAKGFTKLAEVYEGRNYILTEKNGKFTAHQILAQGDWYDRSKVATAFRQIAQAKGWSGGELPVLCMVTVQNYDTLAWVSVYQDRNQMYHTLSCLIQNGLVLVDRTEDEVTYETTKETISVADMRFFFKRETGSIALLSTSRIY